MLFHICFIREIMANAFQVSSMISAETTVNYKLYIYKIGQLNIFDNIDTQMQFHAWLREIQIILQYMIHLIQDSCNYPNTFSWLLQVIVSFAMLESIRSPNGIILVWK